MFLFLATLLALGSAKTSGTRTSSYGYSTTPTAYVAGGMYLSSRNHNGQYYQSGSSRCTSTQCGQTTCGATGEVESLCSFTSGSCSSHGCQGASTQTQCQEAATAAGVMMFNSCSSSSVGKCTYVSGSMNYCSTGTTTGTNSCSTSNPCVCWCVVEDIWSDETDAGAIVGAVFGVLFCCCCFGAIWHVMSRRNKQTSSYADWEVAAEYRAPKYMQVYDNNGEPVYENGMPKYMDVKDMITFKYETDENGVGVSREYVRMPSRDENGCFEFDEYGIQQYQEERPFVQYDPPQDTADMEGMQTGFTGGFPPSNNYAQQPMMNQQYNTQPMYAQQPMMNQQYNMNNTQPMMNQQQQPMMNQQYNTQPMYAQQPMMNQPMMGQPPVYMGTQTQPPAYAQPPPPAFNNAQTINGGGNDGNE